MTDVKKLITEYLDIWLTAETEKKSGRGRSSNSSNSIYGVQKLRELILELAVTGRLTNQKKDEDAKELLSCLLAERAELIKQKKIRNSKVNSIDKSQFHVDIPDNWEICNLGSISKKLTDGSHNPPANNGSGFPMLSSQNINDSKIDFENPSRFVDQSGFEIENARTDIKTGDVLLTIVGTIGRSAVVPQQAPKFVLQRSVAVIQTSINPYYLSLYFHSPLCINYFLEHGKGTAQKGIYLNKLSDLPLALPPLEEQQRIVAKVDELMQLCDQLEQQQNLSSEAHDQLVNTLIKVLINSSDVDEFQQNWQRISENFDLLFTTEYSVEQLKQTILQLAVMGKLVKQDTNDEPASELLEKIAEKKAKLVKEGKVKKSKLLTQVDLDKVPFEIPDSWAWARFSELGEFGRGKSKHRPRNDPALFNPPIYPLIQTGEVARAGNVIFEYHSKYSEVGLAQSRMWSKGTLCITIAANIADSAILGFDACFPDSVVGFTPIEPLHSARYLLFFMKTARQQLLEYAPATAQKNINLEILESVYIPIPPLNEQERIIQTVDEFLNICNVLKDKIKHVNSIKCELSDALVSNALKDSNSIGKPKVAENLIHFEKPIEIVKNSKQKSSDQIDLFTDESVDDDLKLLSLAAEITFQLHTEQTFGHLKLQKLIYLCQQLKHMDLAADFKQHAAGPYDPVMARYLDKKFKDHEWFSYDPQRDLKYKPLSRCNDHRSAFNKYFAKDVTAIYDLIGLFRTSKSDHIEIVATLFACWLRLLENKQSVTEEQLLKDFYAWSEEKNRFSKAEVLNGYKWMKMYSITPIK